MVLIIFMFWLAQRIQWSFVINVLKICIFIINISGEGGEKKEKKEGGGEKKGEKTKPHHILGGEALRLSIACSSPKNKVRVLNVSLLKNCIHMSIVPEGILCIIC